MTEIPDRQGSHGIDDKHRQGNKEGKIPDILYEKNHQKQQDNGDAGKKNHLPQCSVSPLDKMIQAAKKTKEEYGKNRETVCQAIKYRITGFT
jgi:hypothetical protein